MGTSHAREYEEDINIFVGIPEVRILYEGAGRRGEDNIKTI
jgi:hypothetical protein